MLTTKDASKIIKAKKVVTVVRSTDKKEFTGTLSLVGDKNENVRIFTGKRGRPSIFPRSMVEAITVLTVDTPAPAETEAPVLADA